MARKASQPAQPEQQPETQPAEENVIPLGKSDDEVKEQQNDQTGAEPGLANALLDQVEGRQNAQNAMENPEGSLAEPLVDPENPKGAPTHQEISDSVAAEAAKDAQCVQAEQAGNVKNAFVQETRAETLDGFQPHRAEDVRVLVESNDHLDRSGDNVRESEENRIVMSDGTDEARMIDVQPQGAVAEEFDLGNGIRQTNLK